MKRAPLGRPHELRRKPRYKPQGKVRVTCFTSAPGANLACSLLDVSENGVRLALREHLPVGTEVLVAVQRLNRLQPVHRLGKIRWSTARPQGGCVAGIELTTALATTDLARLTEGKDSGRFGCTAPEPVLKKIVSDDLGDRRRRKAARPRVFPQTPTPP